MKKLFKSLEEKWFAAGYFAGHLSKQIDEYATKVGVDSTIEITPEMLLNCFDAYDKLFNLIDKIKEK